jgi:hypothetical protein
MKISINKLSIILGLGVGTIIGCQPEEFGNGNGLVSAPLNPSFTITPVDGKTNTYVLQSDKNGPLGLKWDLGDGTGFAFGKAVDTVAYPDAGKYTIGLALIGKGGVPETTTKDLNVETSDPVSGNLVVGGKMDTGDDVDWHVINISGGVTWNFGDGKYTATGGNWGHQAIYQAIDVEADKKYKVDMFVSGSGATDTWFEVYVGTKEPVDGSDYSDGGIRLGLNTWNGCGKSGFAGKLSSLSCSGTGGGVVQFATSGTVYLLIKTGGANIGTDGISIDNVEFRGVK